MVPICIKQIHDPKLLILVQWKYLLCQKSLSLHCYERKINKELIFLLYLVHILLKMNKICFQIKHVFFPFSECYHSFLIKEDKTFIGVFVLLEFHLVSKLNFTQYCINSNIPCKTFLCKNNC